jgi:hypothetical protein
LKECAGIDDFTGVSSPEDSPSIGEQWYTASEILPGVLTSQQIGASLEMDGFTGVLGRLLEAWSIRELLTEK